MLDLSKLWNEEVVAEIPIVKTIDSAAACSSNEGLGTLPLAEDASLHGNVNFDDDDCVKKTTTSSSDSSSASSNASKSRQPSTMPKSKNARFVIDGQHNTHLIKTSKANTNSSFLTVGTSDGKRSAILAFRKQFQTSNTHTHANNSSRASNCEDFYPSLNASTVLMESCSTE